MSFDRLSPLDASFLHVEDDVSHMHIAAIGIFEGPAPRYADVVNMVRGKLPLVPRYRQVVRFVPLDLGRPVWVDDPHFNIDYHLRHTALPAPGGEAELRALVGRVMAQQLDRSKPLWEIWMVEGLEQGRWALLSKTHHALVDGVAGSDLLAVMMDTSPQATPPVEDDWRPRPAPSGMKLAVGAATDLARSPYEQLRALRASTRVPRAALSRPGRWPTVCRRWPAWSGRHRSRASTARSARIAGMRGRRPRSTTSSGCARDWEGPSTTWSWPPSPTGSGSCSDPGASPSTGSCAPWCRCRCGPVAPVPWRWATARFENKVSAMFAMLPVGIDDPAERLRAISVQMAGLKESKEAVAGEALTSLSGFAPPMLLALGMRLATRVAQRNVNTVTTNVPGPQLPLYVAGRRMITAYPYVPFAGQVRIGLAIFSYDGQVTFGITGDWDTTEDLDVLARGIENGMRMMLALCR